MNTTTKAPNRLINEKSPYLLQHAYNPVDWYPWGEEAFDKAKSEDKPIFLSIGYSTCHWCHVMERESFEDEQVAKALSEGFVAIKVDREERPDVDNIYMNACNMMTGSGGWPLSVFLDCSQKPFFTGTYFPKMGFLSILNQISALWKTQRADIEEQAGRVAEAVSLDRIQEGGLDPTLPHKTYLELSRRFDKEFGGFGSAPKFPSPHTLMFLMRYSQKEAAALPMITKTLDAYRNRGLYDQLGFGFYRYSTDRRFQIPHFEKMLYDNALLCLAYAEGFALTGEKRFARTAREVISYLCGSMYNGEGGFFTAEDADSEGVEGKFYVFDRDEITSALGRDAAEFVELFPVTERGNFEGKNHLYISDRALMDSKIEFVNRCRARLLEVRNLRIRPLRDEKILTAQNGMALAALAVAGRVMDDPGIIEQARKTEGYISGRLTDGMGGLVSCITDGKPGQPGFAEDYAFFVYGLLELYFATGEDVYLQRAASFNNRFISDFACPDGGFYHTSQGAERLIARSRDIYDGAVPSANAVAVNNLLRLARLNHDDGLQELAEKALKSFMGTVSEIPVAHCFSIINLLLLSGGADVVLVGKTLREINELRGAVPYHKCATIRTIVGESAEYPSPDGFPAAYVCADKRCFPPVSGAEELRKLFKGLES